MTSRGFSVITTILIAILAIAYTQTTTDPEEICIIKNYDGILGIPPGFFIPCAMGLVICFMYNMIHYTHGSTSEYLRNIITEETLAEYIERIRKTSPYIGFTAKCYHTYTTSYTYTVYNGGYTTTETRYQMYTVVKHNVSQQFRYSEIIDSSPEPPNIQPWAFFKVECESVIQFTDESTKNVFEREKKEFYDAHKNCDEICEKNMIFETAGFKPKLLCVADPKKLPFLLKYKGYLIASFLCIGYVFENWFERRSWNGKYQFVKKVKK